MKLNLGSGGEVEGYVSIDRKQGKEAYPLDYPDNSVNEVRASHILEHFNRGEVEKVLKDWVRVLKPGGCLKIAVPDFDWIIDNRKDPKIQGYLFGGQIDENDFHRVAFDADLLERLLRSAGLIDIGPWTDEIDDCSRLPVSLNRLGYKPSNSFGLDEKLERVKDDEQIKIVGVMSCPRLGWTDTFGSITSAFMPLGIEVFRHSGVFWGQGLTRLMETALKKGADYIITIDYDSVFERKHIHRMCQLAIENDDVDVIVPVQVRRENDYSMFTMRDGNGDLRTRVAQTEFRKPLTKITTGHFGLTLIKSSSLKRLSKPWFLAIPDKSGEWNEGHVDEDIYFWHNCERSGLNVQMANEVRIGHLQNMIAWPDQSFAPTHQYVGEYNEKGQPKDAGGDLEVEVKEDEIKTN